jgi:ATPase subunit of ABC transporter with duplicated ATPase domains
MADPARADELDRILERFGVVQEDYEHLGGYALESQAREVLHGLGFDDTWIDGDVGALSGGWKMRVAMARALLQPARCAADGRADEPSRHQSIVWLETFLKTLPGSLLMTSHDRDFMNRVVTRIAEIGRRDHGTRELRFLRARTGAARGQPRSRLCAPAGDARQGAAIHRPLRGARRQGRAGPSRVKALEKIEKIELPKRRKVVQFEFKAPPRSGDEVVMLEGSANATAPACSTTGSISPSNAASAGA